MNARARIPEFTRSQSSDTGLVRVDTVFNQWGISCQHMSCMCALVFFIALCLLFLLFLKLGERPLPEGLVHLLQNGDVAKEAHIGQLFEVLGVECGGRGLGEPPRIGLAVGVPGDDCKVLDLLVHVRARLGGLPLREGLGDEGADVLPEISWDENISIKRVHVFQNEPTYSI